MLFGTIASAIRKVQRATSCRALVPPLAFAILLSFWSIATPAAGADANPSPDLEQGFVHPPDSARPWVYWFWMDGNVTRAGITADLEAMQRVGIGGVLLMDVTQGLPRGPVKFNGPEWRALFKHAVAEAGRLGLELSMHNSAGWTGSGGPWITPQLAMQKLVSTKTNLLGPVHFSSPLPKLGGGNASWPFATLAFPAVVGDGRPSPGFPPRRVLINGNIAADASKLFDGDPGTFMSLPSPESGRSQYLQLEFSNGFTAASLKLTTTPQAQNFGGTLQVSDTGRKFRDVCEFSSHGSGLNLSFEPTTARFFRLLVTRADPGLKHLDFAELDLEPVYRVPWYQSKTGAGPMPTTANPSMSASIPPEGMIDPEKVIDLTAQTDSEGVLHWEVPRGHWTVLRLASTPVGTKLPMVLPENPGLECDKLSRPAIQAHFDNFLGQLVAETGTAGCVQGDPYR